MQPPCARRRRERRTGSGARRVGRAGATPAGSLSGTVTDASGAPLAGVVITLRPAVHAHRDDRRRRHVRRSPGLPPGLYTVTATKPGYNGASQSDVAVVTGAPQALNVTLSQATLSSLREIGRVSVNTGRSGFNASPASVCGRHVADVRRSGPAAGRAHPRPDARRGQQPAGRRQQRVAGRDHVPEHPRRALVRDGGADRRASALGRSVRRLRHHVPELVRAAVRRADQRPRRGIAHDLPARSAARSTFARSTPPRSRAVRSRSGPTASAASSRTSAIPTPSAGSGFCSITP